MALVLLIVMGTAAVGFILYTNDFSLSGDGKHPERIVEIRNLTVLGYRGTKRTWQINAAYTWSGYDKSTGHFEGVHDGILYEEDRIVMDHLKAAIGKGDSERAWFQAEGGVKANIYLYKGQRVRHLSIAADKMFYNSSIHKTIVQDKVVLHYQNTEIQADEAEIDHDNNTVIVSKGFHMIDIDKVVDAQRMQANLDTEVAHIQDNICMVIKPSTRSGSQQKATTLDCDDLTLHLSDDDGQRFDFERRVKFMQDDHEVFARRGSYQDQSGDLQLRDSVELVLIDTGTVIRCGQLSALISTPDQSLLWARFNDNVDIQEQDKSVKSETGYFETEQDGLTLKGNVRMMVHQFRKLLRKESTERIHNPEAEDMLGKPALLESDELYLDRHSQNAWATGNVHVEQKTQQARSDRARYVEDEDVIYMDDDVTLLKDNGEWIEAARVIARLGEESFEATGKVQSEFILRSRAK